MAAPKVSVIIPNYNHARYLKRRIDSVLQQTYRDFEVIILDDCSTDNSKEIIESYRNCSFVKEIVFNNKNSGSPFLQWKRGVELAKGEWIWFAETDDYAELDFLDILLKEVEGKDSVGLVYCDSKIMDSYGNMESRTFAEIKNEKFHTRHWSENYIQNGIKELEDYVLMGGTINNSSAVLFRRDLILRTNPFDVPFRYTGDKYAFVKTLSVSDISYVSKALNFYRVDLKEQNESKAIFYFNEQFRIFDYAARNITFKNNKNLYKAFLSNTRNSLIRGWNLKKIRIYFSLSKINPWLMIRCIFNNIVEPFYLRFIPK
jgi:glycosyltransferase involved in cell wall biosynthesis